jgi:hypothetical protein
LEAIRLREEANKIEGHEEEEEEEQESSTLEKGSDQGPDLSRESNVKERFSWL